LSEITASPPSVTRLIWRVAAFGPAPAHDVNDSASAAAIVVTTTFEILRMGRLSHGLKAFNDASFSAFNWGFIICRTLVELTL
jgi:hypothetical protein